MKLGRIKILPGFFFISCLFLAISLFADDTLESKQSTVQNVGGLLFDVDEGVEIEKGPGGSVYVKSNREVIQKKFQTINERFRQLEARISAVEESLSENEPASSVKESKDTSLAKKVYTS